MEYVSTWQSTLRIFLFLFRKDPLFRLQFWPLPLHFCCAASSIPKDCWWQRVAFVEVVREWLPVPVWVTPWWFLIGSMAFLDRVGKVPALIQPRALCDIFKVLSVGWYGLLAWVAVRSIGLVAFSRKGFLLWPIYEPAFPISLTLFWSFYDFTVNAVGFAP